jgi:hypothetical protein
MWDPRDGGGSVNAKRVHRLYREEGLAIRPKLPKCKPSYVEKGFCDGLISSCASRVR